VGVFREYVGLLNIALTRSIFQLKMHQIPFGGRASPGPAGELTPLPSPDTLNWIKGKGVERGERERDGMRPFHGSQIRPCGL